NNILMEDNPQTAVFAAKREKRRGKGRQETTERPPPPEASKPRRGRRTKDFRRLFRIHIFCEASWLISSSSTTSQVKLLATLTTQVFMSDLDVQIPTAFDPFAEANAGDSGAAAGSKDYVHVRIQQRNGRKSLTTVQGLKKEFSYSKILKDLKKEFCCNGTVVQDPELGQVIQLQGDQRKNVSNFLVQAGIVKKEHIKIHGF
ncbi:hypothetical protein EJB05_11997, partial [Eragrostis curvula]